jgi:hypothetical protein
MNKFKKDQMILNQHIFIMNQIIIFIQKEKIQ